MQFEAVMCPQCGGSLEEVSKEGFYTCPYCRSRIRVTFSNHDPSRRPDGRITVTDSNTGEELCFLLLPRDWKVSGYTRQTMQSANWPLTLMVTAQSPNEDAMIHYISGSSFKENISGMIKHVEGAYDQGEMMPMRRMRSAAQYADSIIIEICGQHQTPHLIETRSLPKEPPIDYELKIKETTEQTAQLFRAYTPIGMWSRVDKAFYEGCTRIYDVKDGSNLYRMAVAVLIDGVQISCGAPGMLFMNNSMSYIIWESQYALTLKCSPEKFEQYYQDLIMFCSTMQASPNLYQKIEQMRSRIIGTLQQQQTDRFNAHIQMMKEQQANFDAYNQAWMANSNKRHNASRAASGSQQSARDRMSDMYSEATRGVNTYIRPDGTQVEYSVVNEAAFANVNDSRNTFATQQKDFRSADWVEMKKKY